MKKTLLSFGALAILGLASCGGKSDAENDPNLLVSNDFETMAGWMPEPQNATLTREKAHSGHYSIKVDGGHEYSLGYHALLGQLHETRVKKINVSAWVFVPTVDARAALVTSVGNPAAPDEKPLLWEAIDLSNASALNKWVEIKKTITIPDNAAPTSMLGFYLWRTSGDKSVYLDDLTVTVEP